MTPVFTQAAAGGDTFPPDTRTFLFYRNTNAATRRVVVTVPGLIFGNPFTAVTVTIPATTGEKLIGPLDYALANNTSRRVDVTYPDGVVGVTVASVRI